MTVTSSSATLITAIQARCQWARPRWRHGCSPAAREISTTSPSEPLDPRRLFDVGADGTVILSVHAQPGATRPGVAGVHGDALKVHVREPADRGRANRAIEALLATLFDVPPADVSISGGTTSRAKRVRVEGIDADQATDRLRRALAPKSAGR